ncbi:MAG TPA: amino acid permease [Burkholderiales bacterium]|nr:amino acid permease [Burkholderiales bacterium]
MTLAEMIRRVLSPARAAKDTGPSETGNALGTFAGVFTPSILTILGIILFLRLGYVVGSSGLIKALAIILLANVISVLTTFSVSAIATNFKVKGGGVYYLISRTLGLRYGGSIGIVLFLAQSVSIGFYCVGFAEALAAIAHIDNQFLVQIVAAVAVIALFAVAWRGADVATRVQYFVMALLIASILSFVAGAVGQWDGGVLVQNMRQPDQSPPFWILFAIFFPAVTGFTQGVAMSGDLRDPGKSIPMGTFLAVALSIVVYIGVAILFAGSASNATLAGDYAAMRNIASAGWLIDVGVIVATLSSALASFLGAPRILQSLAGDRIFPFLNWFARGAGPGRNPQRGVALSCVIALSVVALGNLNAIAPVVSMFFLVSYGLVNYATYFEATAASPSFRPTFRWYNRHLSLIGMVACVGVAVAIDIWSAVVAIAILFAIIQYLRVKGSAARWADSRRAFYLKQVRENLLAASREVEHSRDWRPHTLAFSDSPERRARLLRFASWVEGGSGLTTVVRVLEGEGVRMLKLREAAIEEMTRELKEYGSNAFPMVIAAPSFEAALPVVVQAAGTGPISINTVLANWFDGKSGIISEWASSRFGQRLRTAFRLGSNLLILHSEQAEWEALDKLPGADRVIDIWWQADKTGQMMVLLAYLMTRNEEWSNATIRVLVPTGNEGAELHLKEVKAIFSAARIEAETEVVVDADSQSVVTHSAAASIVFFQFGIREGRIVDPFGNDVNAILPDLPMVVMSMAAQDVDLDAQPDQGNAAQSAALLDRVEDARKRAARAQQQAEEAATAASRAVSLLTETATRGADQESVEKLRKDVEAAQEQAQEAARRAVVAAGRREVAERAAREAGLDVPDK